LRIITSHREGADSKSLQIKNIFFPNLSLLMETKGYGNRNIEEEKESGKYIVHNV
jgi:hypothetical protein